MVEAIQVLVCAGVGDDNDELTNTRPAGNLITQRNAIRMLFERINIVSRYVTSVIESEHVSQCGHIGELIASRVRTRRPEHSSPNRSLGCYSADNGR